ncbi:MAG TPA: hypothetical protein DCX52_13965 [Massilia sp.]|nr:hypothetical protein [Massilia sp.]
MEATCDGNPAGEALGMAMQMAMTWPFALAFPRGTIRLLPNVGEDEISYERGDLARAELAQLILLDVVQRHLQRAFALQVWLLVLHGFSPSGAVVQDFRGDAMQ